jgi:hypothetical protein
VRLVLIAALLAGCGHEPTEAEKIASKRVAALFAIEHGSRADADRAVDELVALSKAEPRDVLAALAKRHAAEDLGPPVTRTVLRSLPGDNECRRVSNVSEVRHFLEPAKLRELDRRACLYVEARTLSFELRDIPGMEADLHEVETRPCVTRRLIGFVDADMGPARLAFAAGDRTGAVQKAMAAAKHAPRDVEDQYICHARLLAGSVSESQGYARAARLLYGQIPDVQSDDPCFNSARARMGGLSGGEQPVTHVTGTIDAPGATRRFVAFVAVPSADPSLLFDAKRPSPRGDGVPLHDAVFFVEAAVDGATLTADLPPGTYTVDVELEGTTEFEPADDTCWPVVSSGKAVTLPPLRFRAKQP